MDRLPREVMVVLYAGVALELRFLGLGVVFESDGTYLEQSNVMILTYPGRLLQHIANDFLVAETVDDELWNGGEMEMWLL